MNEWQLSIQHTSSKLSEYKVNENHNKARATLFRNASLLITDGCVRGRVKI